MKTASRIAAVAGLLLVVAIAVAAAWVELTWRCDYSSTPLPAITASTDPAVIARGEYVATAVAHCAHCHSPDAPRVGPLTGGPVIDAGPFGKFHPPNLTPDLETGIGHRSDAELARALKGAVGHDGALLPMMLIGMGPMDDEDIVAVISWLRTLPPRKSATPPDTWGFVGKALAGRFGPRAGEGPAYVAPGGVSVARGAYLVNGPALCAECHTARDPLEGFRHVGLVLAGDPHPHVDKTDAAFDIYAPNITPDAKTGVLARFTEDAFVARFRAGRAIAGSIMPWESFARLTDDDVRSIYRYLQSVPPVANDIGPTRRAR